MASTFFERIDHLSDEIGRGTLRGRLVVDQVYAHYQHEGVEFKHPQGGEAEYLRRPHFEDADQHMGIIAKRVLTADGSEIRTGMAEAMEDLSEAVFARAPHEFGDLRASGHPIVEDDGAVVYDRAPNVHRLSKDELKAKHRVRNLFGHLFGEGA